MRGKEGCFLKKETKKLITCIAVPLATGAVSGFFTRNGMKVFARLDKPPLSPPGWLFPVVWSILYVMMGIASYLIYQMDAKDEDVKKSMKLYLIQLGVNFFWPILFFRFEWYLAAFLWLVLLWILIFRTMHQYKKLSKTACYLMLPYLLWVTFAGYLNLGIYFLNK